MPKFEAYAPEGKLIKSKRVFKPAFLVETFYYLSRYEKIAINKNAKELSLYSKANESALRKNYKKLGFQKDEKEYIEGAYLMRVNTNNFINN